MTTIVYKKLQCNVRLDNIANQNTSTYCIIKSVSINFGDSDEGVRRSFNKNLENSTEDYMTTDITKNIIKVSINNSQNH